MFSCSVDDKIIYTFEKELKNYLNLPENQNMKGYSELIYENYDYIDNVGRSLTANMSIIMHNDKYAVGITNNLKICLYDYKTKLLQGVFEETVNKRKELGLSLETAYYIQNIRDGIGGSYYNPYIELYEDTVKIKEISETKIVFKYICVTNAFAYGSLGLCPMFITDGFHKEIVKKLEAIGITNGTDVIYIKKFKEDVQNFIDPYKEIFNKDSFGDKFYMLRSGFSIRNPYENLNLQLQELGYTIQDIRKQLRLFGLDNRKLEAYIIEITVELLPYSDEPQITYNIIKLSPKENDAE